ncbi:DUF485 domain-containing protein [Paracoccus suum]|uniref:DUF485 domain-containing protein n=1 Tax=Paracoccus suum TaxID=2259340 RepID=A0A344PL84_9RHOB|nr:DUF485 domain-containing protein [Paracoccus suum]AXC50139.1 DUF485 domain-containing protein [Paracoccus suum]
MDEAVLQRIVSDPNYQALRTQRLRFGWTLTIIMMIVYYGFILMIAFGKSFLARPIGNGVTTLGIPLGFGVIIVTVILTAIYVRRANTEFDALAEQVRREALQ